MALAMNYEQYTVDSTAVTRLVLLLALPCALMAQQPVDSVDIRLATIALQRAIVEAGTTSLWSRLMPKVSLGMTLGTSEVLFYETGTTIMPRDSYRLTATLSISDLLDGSSHELALLRVEEAALRLEAERRNAERARHIHALAQQDSTDELNYLQQEALRLARLVEYHELLYRQGRIDLLSLERIRSECARAQNAWRKAQRRHGE